MNFAPLNRDFTQKSPIFPVYCLPDMISQYVSSVAQVLQVPADMVATAVLAVLSASVQGKYNIQATSAWTEPLNLYCAIIGRPSDRKSSVITEVTAPLYDYERDFNQKYATEIAMYQSQHKILTNRISNTEKHLAQSDGAIDVNDLVQLQKDLIKLEQNAVSKLQIIYDDITPESMASEMAKNHEKIAIMSGEGGILGMLSGRYCKIPNMDLFLKAYCGESYTSSRLGRDGEYLQHPLLTMLLGLQPTILDSLINNKEFCGRGLTARFLYSYPDSMIGSRKFQLDSVNPDAKSAYANCLYDLLSLPEYPRTLRLSQKARDLFAAFCDRTESNLNDTLENIEIWAGRINGNTLRIAGIMHCAEYKSDAYNHLVDTDTIYNAISIMDYYTYQALKIFDLEASKRNDTLKYILKKICRDYVANSSNCTITRRELLRRCRKTEVANNLSKYIKILEQHGYIRTEYEGKSEKYYVNPQYLQTLDTH